MQPLFILGAIFLGILLPQGSALTYLIRPNLMLMLFLAFLKVEFNLRVLEKDHLTVVLLNLSLPLLVFYAINWYDYQLALTAFVLSIAPTAAGAPVIATLLKCRIEFVTISTLITNPMAAFTVPFFLPIVAAKADNIDISEVLIPVFITVFIPLFLTIFINLISKRLTKRLAAYSHLAFYLFLFNVYIASGKATDFITHNSNTSFSMLIAIFLLTVFMCLFQFLLAHFLGKRETALERSLSLGRKNSMFAIWVSLTFLNPVIALGPMFYILCQNVYNTCQMYWRK